MALSSLLVISVSSWSTALIAFLAASVVVTSTLRALFQLSILLYSLRAAPTTIYAVPAPFVLVFFFPAIWTSELFQAGADFLKEIMFSSLMALSLHCFKFPEAFVSKLKTSLCMWLFTERFAKLWIYSQWARHFWFICFHKQEVLSQFRRVLALADHLDKTPFIKKSLFYSAVFLYRYTICHSETISRCLLNSEFFTPHFSSPQKWKQDFSLFFFFNFFFCFFYHSNLYVLSPQVLSKVFTSLLWTTLKNSSPDPHPMYNTWNIQHGYICLYKTLTNK